jgi:hypothetical protein
LRTRSSTGEHRRGNYDKLDIGWIREARYRSAVTTLVGIENDKIEDPFRIQRIGMDDARVRFFRLKLTGLRRANRYISPKRQLGACVSLGLNPERYTPPSVSPGDQRRS